nr:DUF4269 domain-containing protein [Filobacillus milosensis]
MQGINYLKNGSATQKQAYKAIIELNIMNDLSGYNPVLCGTIPLNINTSTSDLDIILEVHDFNSFEIEVQSLYSDYKSYSMKNYEVRGTPTYKVNFVCKGFEFELFAQPVPVHNQHAYQHMIIEENIIKQNPRVKGEVLRLKEQGVKTEPAFCKVLGLKGDPYQGLIEYGKKNNMI